MIPALLLGRKGSVGFPGKNTTPILGRKLAEYPILAAKHSAHVDEVFLSTDDPKLMEIARSHGVSVIERPPELCTPQALGEDAYVHGFREIQKRNPGKTIEAVVLLFCNAATLLSRHIDEGIEALRRDETLDSAVTVSQFNWYSPVRARRIGKDGLVHPFIPFENYPKEMDVNCDRNSGGDVYFADVCVSVVRPEWLDPVNIQKGVLPQKWMGQRIYPIKNWGGLDVDMEWQMPQVEFWLRKNGFTESAAPYERG